MPPRVVFHDPSTGFAFFQAMVIGGRGKGFDNILISIWSV